jgi:hypothetical protein
MDHMTVSQFAAELKMPAPAYSNNWPRRGSQRLLTMLSEQDKTQLLDYLRKHGETAEGQSP